MKHEYPYRLSASLFILCYSFSMSNLIRSHENVKVKQIVTLFEEVQNRYVNKLLSINVKHITSEERYKVNQLV